MKFIEIQSLPNGSHRNIIRDSKKIPEGYAVIPEDMETPNFPFGEVTAEEINGVMTVTSWTPGVIPEPDPIPDKPTGNVTTDEMAEAILEGVNEV